MDKLNGRGEVTRETNVALYEFHVDAFLDGVAEALPDHLKYGLTETEAEQVIDRCRKEVIAL